MAEQSPSSIDSFLNQVEDGGIRSNQFQVLVPIPPALFNAYSGSSDFSESISFLSKAASLPASQIGTMNLAYRGRPIRLPGDRDFSPWTITVINSSHFALRRFFESWTNLISNRDTIESYPMTAISVDLEVHQLDRNGKVISEYKMVRAWPSTVSEIPLSYDSKDTIEEFNVTFQYQYWNRKDFHPEVEPLPSKQPSKASETHYNNAIIGTTPEKLHILNELETVARQAKNLARISSF